jgi:uroporphyrinogen decarboxylase
MTNRERVFKALGREQPDKTPYQFGFTAKAMEKMIAYCGSDAFLKEIDNCFHGVSANPGPNEQWLSEHVWQDEFGVQWDRSIDRDIGNVCNAVLPERDAGNLEIPDPHAPERFEGFAEKCAGGSGKCVQFQIGFSLFERAWTLRGGMSELLVDMVEAPGFVHELLDAICDRNVSLVKQAVKYGIDAAHFGDDWGGQNGLLMSPRLWERFLAPRLARQYSAAKEAGKFVSIHSCGKVDALLPRLIELGVDCFNPFQPEVMDTYAMKRLYGDRLAFWGGISTQRLLPYGTADEVRAEAKRMMTEVGQGGGYILAPAHAIPGDAKPENVLALIETARGG